MPKKHIHQLLEELLKNGQEKDIPTKLQCYLHLLKRATLLDLSDLKTSEKAANWFHSKGLIKHTVFKNKHEKEKLFLKNFILSLSNLSITCWIF